MFKAFKTWLLDAVLGICHHCCIVDRAGSYPSTELFCIALALILRSDSCLSQTATCIAICLPHIAPRFLQPQRTHTFCVHPHQNSNLKLSQFQPPTRYQCKLYRRWLIRIPPWTTIVHGPRRIVLQDLQLQPQLQ